MSSSSTPSLYKLLASSSLVETSFIAGLLLLLSAEDLHSPAADSWLLRSDLFICGCDHSSWGLWGQLCSSSSSSSSSQLSSLLSLLQITEGSREESQRRIAAIFFFLHRQRLKSRRNAGTRDIYYALIGLLIEWTGAQSDLCWYPFISLPVVPCSELDVTKMHNFSPAKSVKTV